MPRSAPVIASQRELEVLGVLWEHGPATVSMVHRILREGGEEIAYTTVKTFLDRLEAKGLVRRNDSSFAHSFTAAITRDGWIESRVKEIIGQVGGPATLPVVRALAGDVRLSSTEREKLLQLIDRLELDAKKHSPRKS